MKARLFYDALKQEGFGPFVGVPCSILTPFLRILDESGEGVIASSEGEAVGIASGAYLAGRSPVVFMQNSGLCNTLNPLTSLNLIYEIPLLLIITLRGEPGTTDAPQHRIIGQKLEGFLKLLDIEYRYMRDDIESLKEDLGYLRSRIKEGSRPVALLLRRNTFEKELLAQSSAELESNGLSRQRAITEIIKALDDNCVVVTTTGKITREYYFCEGKPEKNFYMVGSMGCASAIGMGLAMEAEKDKRIVVIDGDGAVLMKMGNLATIGNLRPKNLLHIVVDNQSHESTGGQKTSSSTAALDDIAKACGYPNTYRINEAGEIGPVMKEALGVDGPSLVLIKIAKTDHEDGLGRPKESPEQIKINFMRQIKRAIK